MIFPMFIDGQWHTGDQNNLKDVTSPATGEVLGQIPFGVSEDVDRAVRAARRASKSLERMTVFERAELCQRIANAIEVNRDRLAKLLSLEHGKPLYTEAYGEVDSCVAAFREASEQIKWMDSKIIPTRDPNKRALAFRRPRGVYGIITPWNFPIGCACVYYLAPGLAAGNSIVWVPSPSTSAIASELMRCIASVEFPDGAINLVIGEGSVVGDALVIHELTDAIGFTGSTQTGRIIASRAGAKPCLLELGGNGPTIVLDDADIELAAEAIARGSFSNAGQICTSTERVLVHKSVADRLAEALQAHANNIRLGDPLDPSTTMGPVHNESIAKKVMDHLEDAVYKGAKILTGGKIQSNRPTNLYLEPTVVDYVAETAKLNTDETFGPVAPLIRFANIDDLHRLVASSPYRLSAAVFSRDVERALLLAESLKFGFVNINEAGNYWETQIPAGGTSGSWSGYGRTGGKWSIEEMSEICTVVLNLPGGKHYD